MTLIVAKKDSYMKRMKEMLSSFVPSQIVEVVGECFTLCKFPSLLSRCRLYFAQTRGQLTTRTLLKSRIHKAAHFRFKIGQDRVVIAHDRMVSRMSDAGSDAGGTHAGGFIVIVGLVIDLRIGRDESGKRGM